jgi:hypothetical protein
MIVTPQGGHLGWVAGDEAPFGCPWTDPIVMEFLEHVRNEISTPRARACTEIVMIAILRMFLLARHVVYVY